MAAPQPVSLDEPENLPTTLTNCLSASAEADWHVRVTTLREPRIASSRELNDLYSLRWNIKVDWRTIKVTMNMDMIRCLSPDMVREEITVHLHAYNLVRCAMAISAKLTAGLTRVLSFTACQASLDRLRPTTPSRLTAALDVPD